MDTPLRFSDRLQQREQQRENRRLNVRRQQRQITRLADALSAVSNETPYLRPRIEHAILLNRFSLAWGDLNESSDANNKNPFSLIELRSQIATLLYTFSRIGVISDSGYVNAIGCLDERINGLLRSFTQRHGTTVQIDSLLPDRPLAGNNENSMANTHPWLH